MLDKVEELLKGKGKLIYACKFGSHLYGTNTPTSDIDVKGIFIPNIDYFYSGQDIKQVSFTSGQDNTKNNKDDIDITLYTVQYFIHNLLKNGDTGALDLLFSMNNANSIIYMDNRFGKIFNNKDKIINVKTANAYVGYAIGQAKKYGIKGSRLGVFKQIKEYIETQTVSRNINCGFSTISLKDDENTYLEEIVLKIVEKFYHESYCFKKEIKGIEYLFVCGSHHQYNLSTKEFYERMCKEVERYGDRAKLAEQEGGIDWKALSHAVRVLEQCQELYKEGNITFPLPNKDFILEIKKGNVPFERVEKFIIENIEKVDVEKEKSLLEWKYNNKFCTELIKNFY